MSNRKVFIGNSRIAKHPVVASAVPRGDLAAQIQKKVVESFPTTALKDLGGRHDEDGDEVSVVMKVPGAPSSLVHNASLDEIKVAVSRVLKMPICGWSNFAVESKSLEGHLRRSHNTNPPRDIANTVDRIIAEMEGCAEPRIPHPSDGPHAAVQGLRVRDGFVCQNTGEQGKKCGIGFTSLKSLQAHWRKNLCMDKYGNGKWKKGHVQSVFNGTRRCYFEVTEVAEVENGKVAVEDKDIVVVAESVVDKALHSFGSPVGGVSSGYLDSKCKNTFLEKTKWKLDIEGMDVEALIKLVSPFDKTSPNEVSIKEACEIFLEDVARYCDQEASFLTRRYIMDWDGAQSVGSRAFEARKNEKTMKRYANIVSRLVLMVYRTSSLSEHDKLLKLPESVAAAGEKLRNSLMSRVGRIPSGAKKGVQDSLFEVLQATLCCNFRPGASRRHQVACQFLMFANLSSRFGWLGPSEAGHMVAALQHCCRCVVLARVRDDPDASWERFLEHCMLTLNNRNNSFCAIGEIMKIAATVNRSENGQLLQLPGS